MHRWRYILLLVVVLLGLTASPAFGEWVKKTWIEHKSVVNEASLNNIEAGIEEAKATGGLPSGGSEGQCLLKGTAKAEWKNCTLGSESVLTSDIAKEAVTPEKLAPGLIPTEESKTITTTTTKLNVASTRIFKLKLENNTTLSIENAPVYPYTVEVVWEIPSGKGPYTITWPAETNWSPSEPSFGETEGSINQADLAFAKSGTTKARAYNGEGKEGKEGKGIPSGGTEGQFMAKGSSAAEWQTLVTESVRPWAIAGKLSNKTYPGFFTIKGPDLVKAKFDKMYCELEKGEATVKVVKSGSEIGGLKLALKEATAAEVTGTYEPSAAKEAIKLLVEKATESGHEAEGLMCTVEIESTLK